MLGDLENFIKTNKKSTTENLLRKDKNESESNTIFMQLLYPLDDCSSFETFRHR